MVLRSMLVMRAILRWGARLELDAGSALDGFQTIHTLALRRGQPEHASCQQGKAQCVECVSQKASRRRNREALFY